jgi:hypothetical protein
VKQETLDATVLKQRVIQAAERQAELLDYDLDELRCHVFPYYCDDIFEALRESADAERDWQQAGTQTVWTVYFEPISPPGMVTFGGDLTLYINAETGEVVKYLQGQ